ncbi:MAG: hypothetical protein SGI99_03140, partial [Pseudomonadota bacterium]|nr:hypothetical protein [Pseudomonadota bacterium]
MSVPNDSLWRRAMDEFDVLLDLSLDGRIAALAVLARESPTLAEHVQSLLDTDARAEEATVGTAVAFAADL